MFKSTIRKIKQDNNDFNVRYETVKSQQTKSRQLFNDNYKTTQDRINEVRNQINSTRSK